LLYLLQMVVSDCFLVLIVVFKVFCILPLDGTFTSVFKDKQSKKSHKIIEIKVFLTFLLADGRTQIRSK
jgi:hypothetical protein